jgi:hypothetical protein
VTLDQAAGALIQLLDRKTGRAWASEQHPLATFRYQMFSADDFKRYNSAYNRSPRMSNDFGKPGLEKFPVASRTWQATWNRRPWLRMRRGCGSWPNCACPQPKPRWPTSSRGLSG